MEKQFYPNEEEYEELENTFKIFDWGDQKIKDLNSEFNMLLICGFIFGIGIGVLLAAFIITFCK